MKKGDKVSTPLGNGIFTGNIDLPNDKNRRMEIVLDCPERWSFCAQGLNPFFFPHELEVVK